jgi:hypothetical protein
MAFMSIGDRIKFGKDGIIEEVFSPRYGFNGISGKLIKEVKNCPFFWDLQGQYVFLVENEEYEVGYRNNFFVMKPKGEWIFRTIDEYLNEDDGFVCHMLN